MLDVLAVRLRLQLCVGGSGTVSKRFGPILEHHIRETERIPIFSVRNLVPNEGFLVNSRCQLASASRTILRCRIFQSSVSKRESMGLATGYDVVHEQLLIHEKSWDHEVVHHSAKPHRLVTSARQKSNHDDP